MGVKGGGCSGLSYTFAWERLARTGDEVFEGPDGAKLKSTRKPSLSERHGARLRTSLLGRGCVQQPERQVVLRLWQLFRRIGNLEPG